MWKGQDLPRCITRILLECKYMQCSHSCNKNIFLFRAGSIIIDYTVILEPTEDQAGQSAEELLVTKEDTFTSNVTDDGTGSNITQTYWGNLVIQPDSVEVTGQ